MLIDHTVMGRAMVTFWRKTLGRDDPAPTGTKDVQEWWDRQPCDAVDGGEFREGSLEYFERIEERRYKEQTIVHAFAQFTRWRGKKVLEIGCGVGTDLLQFARAEAHVCGIDLSRRSTKLTKDRLRLYEVQGEVIIGDGENLPLRSNTFDLIYAWGSIHHSPNPCALVQEVRRALKPGGTVRAMVYRRFSGTVFLRYLKHALAKGKPFRSLSSVVAEHVESPGTRAYRAREVKKLFDGFILVRMQAFVPDQEREKVRDRVKISWLADLYPNWLAFWMFVEARKPADAS